MTPTKTEVATMYLNPTTDQVWLWLRAGLCAWCGSNCPGDQCYARKCDCCSEVWKSNTLADVSDGYKLTEKDCPPCAIWMAMAHL